MKAGFEEKQYESAANIELAFGNSRNFVHSSGQVFEAIVGYDAIAHADSEHVIWQILALPRPPGVRLVPELWKGGQSPRAASLPSHPVNLFLQYKRPEWMYGHRAAQWSYWRSSFYRFTLEQRQQEVLLRLEANLSSDAIVRYASPAFSDLSELEARQLAGEILNGSGFVAPSSLQGHKH